MEALTNYFFDKNCNKILDVGTGSGSFINVLKNAFPKGEITGIDPLKESLQIAQQFHPDIQFLHGNAEKLPFDSSVFDVVSISLALHHLAKVSKGLREMKRVVKKNGFIIINEIVSDNLNPAQEVHKLYHHFRSQTDRILGNSHNETFTKDQVIQMVEAAGISIQFFFEHKDEPLTLNKDEIENRVESMEKMLETIKEKPEYKVLKNQIPEFKDRASKYGFQPATKVVIVGRKI